MSTGEEKEEEEGKSKIRMTAGQVRGPIQLTFARSVDQVVPLEHSITRMAVTNERDLEEERTMGRKFTIPYALYRCYGFISAALASQTHFSEADLELFWQSLTNMFEHDRSAARGQMATRKLIAFKHESALGNTPAHKLFDLVKVKRSTDETKPARAFSDYVVEIDKGGVPAGITLEEKI
jgi:CRISPR-associated protein Csd2